MDKIDILSLCLSNIKEPKDKYYQEFHLFIHKNQVRNWIRKLRSAKKVNTKGINLKLKKLERMLKEEGGILSKLSKIDIKSNRAEYLKIEDKIGYKKIRNGINKLVEDLVRYMNSKFPIVKVKNILNILNKPFSWQYPLEAYFFTGKIITPSVKCEKRIDKKKNKVILELSPEATIDDIKQAWLNIEKLQSYLRGYELKNKRYKKKFDEKIKIINAAREFHNPYKIIDKVYGDNGNVSELSKDNKRRAVIRQTKHKYKKYL